MFMYMQNGLLYSALKITEYVSTVKNMETDEGLEIKEEELDIGDVVLWQYRGAPYKAEILQVHGMQTLYINL